MFSFSFRCFSSFWFRIIYRFPFCFCFSFRIFASFQFVPNLWTCRNLQHKPVTSVTSRIEEIRQHQRRTVVRAAGDAGQLVRCDSVRADALQTVAGVLWQDLTNFIQFACKMRMKADDKMSVECVVAAAVDLQLTQHIAHTPRCQWRCSYNCCQRVGRHAVLIAATDGQMKRCHTHSCLCCCCCCRCCWCCWWCRCWLHCRLPFSSIDVWRSVVICN